MKMVPTVEYGGKSYRVPACTIKKQEDAAKMVDPKLQKRRLSKLKSAISKYASESGETLSAEQVGEIIKLMTLPDGYLPAAIEQPKVEEQKKENADVKIIKKTKEPASVADKTETPQTVVVEPVECKTKCDDCPCIRVPLHQSRRELFN
jgi:succinate dehydrogenase flavin-adding protein (antitoxin of CptAB toxin-antitoxin module)